MRGGRQGCPRPVTFIDRDMNFQLMWQPRSPAALPPSTRQGASEDVLEAAPGCCGPDGVGIWGQGVHPTQAGCPGAPELALAASRPQFQEELCILASFNSYSSYFSPL